MHVFTNAVKVTLYYAISVINLLLMRAGGEIGENIVLAKFSV
jgi:hypothetical protein